jgi:cytochrome c
MDSGFTKNIIISLAIALGIVIVVNIIGELSIRPREELVAPKRKQAEKATEEPRTKTLTKPTKAAASDISNLLSA